MFAWGNQFASIAKAANRPTEISVQDIELTLSVQGQLDYYLNKKIVSRIENFILIYFS